MGQPTRVMLELTDFPGLMSSADADDIPPGAAETQVNMTCTRQGALTLRGGYRKVSFDEDD